MIGTTLGAYRITAKLGSGGMGTVYAATVVEEGSAVPRGTRVALKLVHPHLLEMPGYFERFAREGRIGRSVRHANVVRTFDAAAAVVDGVHHHFLVMEFVQGQTVRAFMEELGTMSERLCRHIGCEVARGLAAIHDAGAVHRDLKPENVLITPQHEVKVMDLGVARLTEESLRLSRTGAFFGSVRYAAPEQFGSAPEEVDHRADLHAVGLFLHELACGRHPFEHDDLPRMIQTIVNETPRDVSDVQPGISAFYDEVVRRLLDKSPDERFQTARELADALNQGETSAWWAERSSALRPEARTRRLAVGRETRLYGRDEDLARLRACFERARGADGQVVLIEGEAGIGKTRLVDELVHQFHDAGEDVCFEFGAYPPTGAAAASGAFSTAFREQLGPAGSGPLLTEMPLLAPAFDAVLRGHAVPRHVEPLTHDSLATCFIHVTRGLAADRPLVLLIDDLHFAPDDALGLFAALALAVPGHRVLLIGTMRPGVSKEWIANLSRLDHVLHMAMTRLGPKALALLLEESFRSKRMAEDLDHQIALTSDGNPFFVFEIIRGLREGGFIRQTEDGSWDTAKVIDRIAMPPSVLDLVNARTADLDEQEREILDVAACCGCEFDPRLVGDVVGMSPIPLLRSFARIERKHRLVRSAGAHFAFDHHQLQEAIYASLPEMLRREYHAALGEALETREKAAEREPTELDGELAVRLCEHLLSGDQGVRALRYLEPALDHLAMGHLIAEVVAVADRVLRVPELVQGEERVELLLRAAAGLDHLGRIDAERTALDEALSLAETLAAERGARTLLARVAVACGGVEFRTAHYPEAARFLSRGRDVARSAGDRATESSAVHGLGSVALWQGRYAEASEHFEESLAVARSLGDRRRESSAIGNLGNACNRLGRLEEAREHYERSLSVAREIGFVAGEASALGNVGLVMRRTGRYDEARAHFEQALEMCRRIGERRGEISDTGNLGNVLFSTGHYEQARSNYERTLALAKEIGDRRWEGLALHNLANTYSRLGDVDRARELLQRSRSLAEEIGDRGGVDYGDWLLGDLAVWIGADDEAERRMLRAAESFRAAGSIEELSEVLVSLGALYARTAREADAREHFREAVELAGSTSAFASTVLARCHLAALGALDSRVALDDLASRGARLEHHQRMQASLLMWRAGGDSAHLATAKRLLADVLADAPSKYHDAMLCNVPLNREVVAARDRAPDGADEA